MFDGWMKTQNIHKYFKIISKLNFKEGMKYTWALFDWMESADVGSSFVLGVFLRLLFGFLLFRSL